MKINIYGTSEGRGEVHLSGGEIRGLLTEAASEKGRSNLSHRNVKKRVLGKKRKGGKIETQQQKEGALTGNAPLGKHFGKVGSL